MLRSVKRGSLQFLFGSICLVGSYLAMAEPLPAQSNAAPPDTISILEPTRDESLSEIEETLPAPLPLPDSTPEPPQEEDADIEPEPLNEVMDHDPFANLFLDLPTDVAREPSAPNELEEAAVAVPKSSGPSVQGMNTLTLQLLPTEHGYSVVLAGPVHEALLSLSEIAPLDVKSIVVSSSPPPPVREQAPQARDAIASEVPQFVGNDVQWISGYWAWLDDSERFVWVSGLYRDVPPGRRWMPGAWGKSEDSYRWTSGYWAETNEGTQAATRGIVSAEPLPPRRDESSTAPPNKDSFWIPGQWLVEDNRDAARQDKQKDSPREVGYRWRPGYWSQRAGEWIWQVAQYIPTPQGYVYVSGYWDYEPHFRGQAYAAVVFDTSTPGIDRLTFVPRYPLCRPAATLLHLFSKPGSCNYFYGDFYDRSYAELGYQPWYQASGPRLPSATRPASQLLSFYNWKYDRQGIDFVASMSRFADHFRSAPTIRPAAQIDSAPRLVPREGLAGEVNAATFDAIVRGNVGGYDAVWLAGAKGQPTDEPKRERSLREAPSTNLLSNNSSAISSEVATASAHAPVGVGASEIPRGAAPLSMQGTAGLMVLPGGRIIVAPRVAPFGPVPSIGRGMPTPPMNPPGNFVPRFRRR